MFVRDEEMIPSFGQKSRLEYAFARKPCLKEGLYAFFVAIFSIRLKIAMKNAYTCLYALKK